MFKEYAQVREYLRGIGAVAGDPLSMPLAQAREQQENYFRLSGGQAPAVPRSDRLSMDGPHGPIGLDIVYPRVTKAPLPMVLFVRGAGWWAGSLDSHAATVRRIAMQTDCAVCAVDFRRTPEHRYPVQVDEVLATINWLREQAKNRTRGLLGDKLVLFGESAGATLCLSAAQLMRDRGYPPAAGLVLFYSNAGGPQPTAREYSRWVWQQYLGDLGPEQARSAIPFRGDLSGLPPAWLGVGEDDPLKSDNERLAAQLAAAGNTASLTAYPKLPHGFVMLSGWLEPAASALRDACVAIGEFAGWKPPIR